LANIFQQQRIEMMDGPSGEIKLHDKLLEIGYQQQTPFSAFAQLIENSVNAESRNIDITVSPSHNNISIRDDGIGMNMSILRAALTNKIGGLIKSTMRLGSDVLIFSKTKSFYSLAFLSRTLIRDAQYNEKILLPICSWSSKHKLRANYGSPRSALKIILKYTNLNSSRDIKNIFNAMPKTGTLISIANLSLTRGNESELDFSSVLNDIQMKNFERNVHPIHYSLRKYLESLYLVPRARIILRDEIIDCLPLPAKLYKPTSYLNEKFHLIYGFNTDPESFAFVHGIYVYSNNRLVVPCKPIMQSLNIDEDAAAITVICQLNLQLTESKDDLYSVDDKQDMHLYVQRNLENYMVHSQSLPLEHSLAVDALRSGGTPMLQCGQCLKWRNQSGRGTLCSSTHLVNDQNYDCASPEQIEELKRLNLTRYLI
jgi:hypothetical protein